jgi:ABC-type multidrug transport system fused ATPase/permease subunit
MRSPARRGARGREGAEAGAKAFVRHVWPLVRRYRWPAAVALVLTSAHGLGIALQNAFPKWFFAYALQAPGLTVAQRWQRVAWLSGFYLVASAIVRMACWHLGYRLFTRVRERIVFALRGHFFRHVNDLCLRFHGRHSSGELFSYLFGAPIAAVLQFLQHATMSVPGAVVTIVTLFALFWQWDRVVAVMLIGTSLLSVLMMLRARDRMAEIGEEFQTAEGDVSGRVADLLRGSKAVKLYAMEAQVVKDFEVQAELLGQKSYERDVKSHVEWMKQEGFGYICYVLLMSACTWRYLDGRIPLGVVAACFTSFVGLQWPLQTIFQAFTFWGGAAAAFARIGAVLETPSTTPDPPHPQAAAGPRAELAFDRVSFAYEPNRPVVRELSLAIPPGQRIAFVGPSGAGKTTVAQLLLRLYDPDQGSVRLGGTDLRRLAAADLRRHFGVVPQDPFIFRTSVRDNVRVARPEADDAAIRRACELANAWEFIAQLPGGLDGRVGEGGASLSGGQRQRLAIARALLADPPCFIFDEATSALDTLSEQLIQEALERNLGERTVIFIAHRLATVRNCDRIVVIADGRAVQDGPYGALIAQPGLFRDLVRGQSLRE